MSKSQPIQYLYKQKGYIESFYDCFECKIDGDILYCYGEITPTDFSTTYKCRIKYEFGAVPEVTIMEPEIDYDFSAHMYKYKKLCLYDPREQPWSREYLIADTIIPWLAEWLVYYELYKITGKWEGPEAPHSDVDKEAVKEDED